MLGQHPQLYGFPEMHLFYAPTIEAVLTATTDPWSHWATSGLIRAVAQVIFGDQTAGTIEQARSWLDDRKDLAPHKAYDFLLDRVAPLIGLEKTPETAISRTSLRRLLAAYPDARFVHLTRGANPTIASMLVHWGGHWKWQTWDHDTRAAYATRSWFMSHRKIIEFGRTIPSDRWIQIRAEDLLEYPHPILRRFCQVMNIRDGLDEIEGMLHPERSPFAFVGPETAPGGNDPGFLRDPSLRLRPPQPSQSSARNAAPAIPEAWRKPVSELEVIMGYKVTSC